jgi:glycerol uptake facilitator-like aquaporin
MSESE